MARIVKPEDSWHALRVITDRDDGEVFVVTGGRNAYLWAGRNNGEVGCVTVSGAATLRKLAKAILAEVGDK